MCLSHWLPASVANIIYLDNINPFAVIHQLSKARWNLNFEWRRAVAL